MRHTLLALGLAALPPGHALAAPVADADIADLDRIVVTATRTGRSVADVPSTVDVIDRERMDAHLVRDLRDLFRYEPGVSVSDSFGRFGIGDIRIRGLGGNRVRIQTDGIAVPDAFAIGSFSNANRNFVALDTLKRVEVVRGPTSSLYGSDALGGTVSFITRDPSDYLGDGRDTRIGLGMGFEGDWNGLWGSTTLAAGGERWSGMVALGHRQGRETANMGEVGGTGSARTRPNPQERDGRNLLAKLVYAPSQRQRLRLTVEGNEDRADTAMLTAQGPQALTGAINNRVGARDQQTRARLSLSHQIDGVGEFADAIEWQVYRQDSETTQYTVEERSLPAPVLRDTRERSFNFDQRLLGLQFNARKSLGETVVHALAWGLDVSRTRTKQKRDGLRSFPLTGAQTPVMLPDVFPVRDFPVSRTTSAALYVQDEISIAGGALRLVPGLRIDRYELEPEADGIFAADNPGVAVVALRETSVSPRLGAVWHFGDRWSLFGGYARGFRSPPYADVNIGFTNVMFGYTAIPNPDLRPETSDGFELGLRHAGSAVHASLAAYHNRYADFIESFGFVGFNAEGLMLFQSRNVASARIEGVELKAGLELDALSATLAGWSLRGAAAWSRGEDRGSGEPLESVDPLTATLGFAYEGAAWGGGLSGRFVGRRDRMPSAPAGTHYFRSPGHAVLDLHAHWRFAPGARAHLGVFNLADRRYWPAGSVPLVDAGSGNVDRYTAPGRHLAASVSLEW